jgi:hypothetical protein
MKRCWEYLYLFLTKRNCHTIPVFTLHGTVIHVGLGVRDPNVLDGSSTDGRKNRGASWGGSWSALESEYDSKQKIHLFVKRLNGSRLNQWSLTWAVHQVSKAPQKNARKIRGSQKVFNGTPKLYCRNKIFQIENWIKSPPPLQLPQHRRQSCILSFFPHDVWLNPASVRWFYLLSKAGNRLSVVKRDDLRFSLNTLQSDIQKLASVHQAQGTQWI